MSRTEVPYWLKPKSPGFIEPKRFIEMVPKELLDIQEWPDNLVPVYTVVTRENLESIRDLGLLVSKNNAKRWQIAVIFEQERPERFTSGRLDCIYARPKAPHQILALENLKKGKPFLEILIDPTRALVADTALIDDSMNNTNPGMINRARELAKVYWAQCIPFPDYQKLGKQSRSRLFRNPEVLIPEDIPPSRIRVYGLDYLEKLKI